MQISSVQTNKEIQFNQDLADYSQLPGDLIKTIFENVKNDADLKNCFNVCKAWDKCAQITVYKRNVFTEIEWNKFFGQISNADGSPIPKNINSNILIKICNGRCPVFRGKKFWETHVVVLIPELVNDKPLTLEYFGGLIKKYYPQNKDGYYHYDDVAKKEVNPTEKSNWIIMTKHGLPGSKKIREEIMHGEYIAHSRYFLYDFAEKHQINYQQPKILETAITIMATLLNSGVKMINNEEGSFTYCRERDFNKFRTLAVGLREDNLGLAVVHNNSYDPYDYCVVGVLRMEDDWLDK